MKHTFAFIAALTLASAATGETVAELHEAELKAIDANNDGFLSKDEFNAFSDYAFQEMDDDKNGTLGQDETKPFLDIKQFQSTDRNGDSLISRAEYDAQMSADFDAADQDGNGQLD
ncbi:EF-hand domain-containing protein [Ruegeria sp.]|uniref:EF-hand domain-containing protein n=1 Tax=Ruegeria sp. TaxID=1879320 RepID=UPI00230BEACA|nr:EF-hand domain-containing protein [Ruegeria sp.]MDA7965857.1 EF-hand domain-containing protein [Ruegeria sp.]